MIHMQPVRFGRGYPDGDEYSPKSDQTFPIGTPVTFDAVTDHALEEHALASTVTGVLGVSLEGVTAGVSSNISGKVNVAKAGRNQTFMALLTNGTDVPVAPDANNLLVSYGLVKHSTGANAWFSVDESDTSDVHVKVTGYDLSLGGVGVVFFKFLESVIQEV